MKNDQKGKWDRVDEKVCGLGKRQQDTRAGARERESKQASEESKERGATTRRGLQKELQEQEGERKKEREEGKRKRVRDVGGTVSAVVDGRGGWSATVVEVVGWHWWCIGHQMMIEMEQ